MSLYDDTLTDHWKKTTGIEKEMLVNLLHVLKCEPREMPFHSDKGIALQDSLISKLIPNYYLQRIQQQYSRYFKDLSITLKKSYPITFEIKVTLSSGEIVYQLVQK
jgi:hypothetical protein